MERLGYVVMMCTMLLSSLASAQSRAGDVHLALEGSLLSLDRGTEKDEAFDAEQDRQALEYGFPLSSGARAGYAILDALEVGVAFAFSHRQDKNERGSLEDKSSESEYLVGAYLRYLAPGDRIRFFIGPILGGAFYRMRDPDEQSGVLNTTATVSGKALVVGAETGIYGFVLKGFSIDPFVRFAYLRGSAEVDNAIAPRDLELSGFHFALGLSLSGWIATR